IPEIMRLIIAGTTKFLPKFLTVECCQEISGHTAIKNKSASKMGGITVLKNGIPTVTFVPVTASLTNGKIVPQNTANVAPIKIRLLIRKELSFDINDSICPVPFRSEEHT